jgi:hypothetical protein
LTDHVIRLVDPEGLPLEVVVVTTGRRAGAPSAVFEIGALDWGRVASEGLLRVDAERARGPWPQFDETQPVHVDVVLDPGVPVQSGGDVSAQLLSARDAGALRRTDAWWALSATQEVELPPELRDSGTLREGVEFERPPFLEDAKPSVGLDEVWSQAMDATDDIEEPEPMLRLVLVVFDDNGGPIERPLDDATVVHAPVAGVPIDWDLYVRTDEERHLLTAYAVLAAEVAPERLPKVHELAARLNGRMPLGSYEVNADDGVMSFKAAIDVTGDELSFPLVRQLLGAVLAGGEYALVPYLDVALGGDDPADVVAALESP